MYSTHRTVHALLSATVTCIYFDIGIAQEFEEPVRMFQQAGVISNGRPWNIPASDFDSLLSSNPNATGTFPVTGPNISLPVSGSSNIYGWSWSISVVADIPIRNSSWEIPERTQSYTGGSWLSTVPHLYSPSLRDLSLMMIGEFVCIAGNWITSPTRLNCVMMKEHARQSWAPNALRTCRKPSRQVVVDVHVRKQATFTRALNMRKGVHYGAIPVSPSLMTLRPFGVGKVAN